MADKAKKKEDKKKNNELIVDITDSKIRVEKGKDFVEGDKIPNLGQKRKMQNIMRPNKMQVKGENDVTMYLDDYTFNTDLDLYIMIKMLTDWSNDKKINQGNLLEEKKLIPLLEKFVDEFKEINELKRDNKDNEKKQSDNES